MISSNKILKLRVLILLTSLIFSIANASDSQTSSDKDLRIISTDGFVTEILWELGLARYLVGVDVTSRLPESSSNVPNIGYHRNLSAEGLLDLKPSLVIGSKHIGPESVLLALNKASIPLIQLESAKTITQLKRNISIIAETFGEQDKAEQIISNIDKQMSAMAKMSFEKERIAFLLSTDPSKLRLAGKNTNADAFISMLGAKTVGNFENYQNVSAESLLALDPTIILIAGREAEESVDELLRQQPLITHSLAGKKKRILSFDGSALIAGLSIASISEAIKLSHTLDL